MHQKDLSWLPWELRTSFGKSEGTNTAGDQSVSSNEHSMRLRHVFTDVVWNGSAYHVSYTPTRSGRHTLSATIAATGQDMIGSPYTLVSYAADSMCASLSKVVGQVSATRRADFNFNP
jgi:hypothetical protein